jgi:hypothetical protein
MLIFAPGGATITGFEARNTVTCIALSAGVFTIVENAKTTVGKWNIFEIIGAMAESSFIANPALRMVRQNAQIAHFSRDVAHVDRMRICNALSTEWQLIVLDPLKTSPACSKPAASPTRSVSSEAIMASSPPCCLMGPRDAPKTHYNGKGCKVIGLCKEAFRLGREFAKHQAVHFPN